MYDQRDERISRSNILYGTSTNDVWFSLDQFYRDQIEEVNEKLARLDDEIWCKMIFMERNKRVAKAYVRTARFRVDGSCHEFDGQRIGYKSFENSDRDAVVKEIRDKIGVVFLKLDPQGNVWLRRCEGSSPVIVQGWHRSEAHSYGADIRELRGRVEADKMIRVFDMRLFKTAIDRELTRSYPDRKKLLYKTAVRISLVKEESHPFKTPCWFMLINLVALDMLNANVPSVFPTKINFDENPQALSRCHSMANNLEQSGKHSSIGISSNELYFSRLSLLPASNRNGFREIVSPVWSDIYDTTTSGDSSESPNPLEDIGASAETANRLALGYTYAAPRVPRWSTTLARSMDCLYGTKALTVAETKPQRCFPNQSTAQEQHRDDIPRPAVQRSPALPYKAPQNHPRAIYAATTDAHGNQTMQQMPVIRSGGQLLGVSIPDSDSCATNGRVREAEKEIYASSTNICSNSSSEVSCRPSSPSVASETASSHRSSDSTVSMNGKVLSIPITPSTLKSTKSDSVKGSTVFVPEPPPRPKLILKNTVGLKFPPTKSNTNQIVSLAKRNNAELASNTFVNNGHPYTDVGIRKMDPCRQLAFRNDVPSSSDSDSDVCRL